LTSDANKNADYSFGYTQETIDETFDRAEEAVRIFNKQKKEKELNQKLQI
jgi:hypothetical protein